jgi:hypothetical protein
LRIGTLAITDNAAGSPQTVSLGGNLVTTLPTSLAFGSFMVGTQSPPQMVVVTNNQSVAITLGVSLGGANPANFAIAAGTTCGSSLAATSSCVYAVIFKPLAKKSRSATLSITASPDPASPHAIGLSGTGT